MYRISLLTQISTVSWSTHHVLFSAKISTRSSCFFRACITLCQYKLSQRYLAPLITHNLLAYFLGDRTVTRLKIGCHVLISHLLLNLFIALISPRDPAITAFHRVRCLHQWLRSWITKQSFDLQQLILSSTSILDDYIYYKYENDQLTPPCTRLVNATHQIG